MKQEWTITVSLNQPDKLFFRVLGGKTQARRRAKKRKEMPETAFRARLRKLNDLMRGFATGFLQAALVFTNQRSKTSCQNLLTIAAC